MPGNPRPALPNARERAPAASWFVVKGVRMLAGKPLVGAEEGSACGVVTGGRSCR
jgi:hypothetical protein